MSVEDYVVEATQQAYMYKYSSTVLVQGQYFTSGFLRQVVM